MTHDTESSPDTTADAVTAESPDSSGAADSSMPATEPTTASALGEETTSGTSAESRAEGTPSTEAGSAATGAGTREETGGDEQLVPHDVVMDYRARWEAIQQGFVDDPRNAVSDADSLVDDVLEKLSQTFEDQHGRLEAQWNDGEPDTEDLRYALRRYRDFFDRLLAI